VVRIQDLVSFFPLDQGWVKIRIRIFCVKILKFFHAETDPGILLTLDPGGKKIGSGINIPDP
jgi:hypothetical protein